MAAVLLTMFKLKPGVPAADYERWAEAVNAPASRSLPSVTDWRVHRVTGVLGSDGPPPFDYVEVVQVTDLEQLGRDASGERMQQVSRELDEYTHGRVMLLAERFG